MAALQFLLDSDAAGGQNKFLLNSDDPLLIAISFSAQQGQQSSADLVAFSPSIEISPRQPQQASIAFTNWAYTTLAAPINYGPGSIANLAWFVGDPAQVGDVVAYDASLPIGLSVATNGDLSWAGYGTVQVQYNDGTGWFAFLLTNAPWNVSAQQGQQSAVSVGAAAGVAFTAQQGQQVNADVSQLGQLAFTSQQGQRATIVVRATATFAASAQQGQQSAVGVTVSTKLATNAQQGQQSAVSVAAAASPAFAPQQGQQINVNVVAQTRADIATDVQQAQQSAFAVRAVPVVSGFASQQGQQAAANVLVPQPVPIAMSAQQGQQAAVAVGARASLSLVASQSQQADVSASAYPRFAAAAQQGQQITVVIPNLPAPVLAFESAQSQQGRFDVVSANLIALSVQQGQQGAFVVLPLPSQMPDIDSEGITFDYMTNPSDSQPYTKVIYLGRDNATNLGVLYYGAALDLGAITRMLIELPSIQVTIDSNDYVDSMSWEPGSNVIKFKLGATTLVPPGIYGVALVVYDAAHPNGQILAGPAGDLLLMDFAKDMVA